MHIEGIEDEKKRKVHGRSKYAEDEKAMRLEEQGNQRQAGIEEFLGETSGKSWNVQKFWWGSW
jgi:hypothetical protein